MKPSRTLLLLELGIVVACLGVALILPVASLRDAGVLGFLIGLTILALSDVWLPRGDAVGMSSSLAIGAMLLFDARVVLGMLIVAELLALIPSGRNAMWPRALGALTGKALAVVTCSALLVPFALHPSTGLLNSPLTVLRPEQYSYILVLGLFFAALEFGLMQLELAARTRQPIRAALLGSLAFGGWLIAAQASAGILAALMYRTMGVWGLAVTVIMILVMRQSFVLLLEIRQAYNATIDVLIRAMDVQSPGREGAAERDAALCTSVGRMIGVHGHELERLRYAALLRRVGTVDEPQLGEERVSAWRSSAPASRIVADVEFLRDVVPILRICDATEPSVQATRSDLTCSYVVVAVGAATGSIASSERDRVRDRVSPRIVREIDRALGTLMPEVDTTTSDARGAGSE
jgi:hypothetical protein